MNSVKISKFEVKDVEQVEKLLKETISDNFKNNEIVDEVQINEEIEAQIKLVQDFIDKKDTCISMFCAKLNNELVGIVAYGAQTPKISLNIEDKYRKVLEIKNLYILPKFQKMGLGKKMFNVACSDLIKNGYTHFMLYSSFKTGQAYWTKQLGEPYKTIKDNNITRKIWLQLLNL